MNARLERKLRMFAVIIMAGTIAGFAVSFALGRTSLTSMAVGVVYGLLISATIGGVELFVLDGPMRAWLGNLSFTANLIVRSAIYASIIVIVQLFQLGELIAGVPLQTSSGNFWFGFIYSAVLSVLMNLVFGIANLIGPRALLNFITGRYHAPVEENRFVLFVDIAGSTGLAERLGGIGIHRFLDRTFRLLTVAVVDYSRRGAELCRRRGDRDLAGTRRRDRLPSAALLHGDARELSRASSQFEREFGASPRIRGSLHFGPVIVGEIGDIKRAIVFNGDVMNTAARLEELSRAWRAAFLRPAPRWRGSAPRRRSRSRSRAVADSRTRRWHRRGRPRRVGALA